MNNQKQLPDELEKLVDKALHLAGEMPDQAAHRRYLTKLSEPELWSRIKALSEEGKPKSPVMEFWTKADALQMEFFA